MAPPWVIYEDAARKVLADIREELGIASVKGKQTCEGKSSATWEIDAKAWVEGSDGFLVVEVRQHTTSGLKQEDIAAIAYRIKDLGGAGGIVVTPLPLQKGAKTVAASEHIAHVLLSADSTTESYLAEFLGRTFHGASVAEFAHALDICDAEVIRAKPDSI